MAEPLSVVTVCGVGMGSSLILKMTAEAVFRDLGLEVRVENTDLPGLRGMRPDIVLAQPMHAAEIRDAAPIVVEVTDFINKDKLRAVLEPRLREAGYLP